MAYQRWEAEAGIGPPDVGPPDVGTPDVGPPDVGTPDVGPPDVGPPDVGPQEPGVGPEAGMTGFRGDRTLVDFVAAFPVKASLAFSNLLNSSVTRGDCTFILDMNFFVAVISGRVSLSKGSSGTCDVLRVSGKRMSRTNSETRRNCSGVRPVAMDVAVLVLYSEVLSLVEALSLPEAVPLAEVLSLSGILFLFPVFVVSAVFLFAGAF